MLLGGESLGGLQHRGEPTKNKGHFGSWGVCESPADRGVEGCREASREAPRSDTTGEQLKKMEVKNLVVVLFCCFFFFTYLHFIVSFFSV